MLQPGGPLPHPDDPELPARLSRGVHGAIYRIMYEHRDCGLTYQQMREIAGPPYGGHSQFDRRVRDLRKFFVIEHIRDGRETKHRLIGVREEFGDVEEITGALRSRVLEPQRCFRCGKTPEDDGVKLVADHKIPREWGGPTELWNLQPLCATCNGEKKDRLSHFDADSDKIESAIGHDEVQRRIGELLLAFEGAPVPADLVQLVASGGEYRNDWERRFRDLRTLGWDVRVQKVYNKQGKPVDAEYWVEHAEPWPTEPILRVLRRVGEERKAARQAAADG